MSSHETHETRRPCPCGNGHVVTVRFEWNNIYSPPNIEHHLACQFCEATYVVDGDSLYARADVMAHQQAFDSFKQLDEDFRSRFLVPLAAEIEKLARAGGRTKAHWLQALAPLADSLASGTSHGFNMAHELQRTSLHDFCHAAVNRQNYAGVAAHFPVLSASGRPELLDDLNVAWREYERTRPRPVQF